MWSLNLLYPEWKLVIIKQIKNGLQTTDPCPLVQFTETWKKILSIFTLSPDIWNDHDKTVCCQSRGAFSFISDMTVYFIPKIHFPGDPESHSSYYVLQFLFIPASKTKTISSVVVKHVVQIVGVNKVSHSG